MTATAGGGAPGARAAAIVGTVEAEESDLALAAALVSRLERRDRTPTEAGVLSNAKAWLAELLAADVGSGDRRPEVNIW